MPAVAVQCAFAIPVFMVIRGVVVVRLVTLPLSWEFKEIGISNKPGNGWGKKDDENERLEKLGRSL
jgi:hypothetical protein